MSLPPSNTADGATPIAPTAGIGIVPDELRTVVVIPNEGCDAQNRELDDITGEIVDAAVKLHMRLGPGLLETVYEVILARVLTKRGLFVERQKEVSFEYDGLLFEDAFRPDLIVEKRVIVELKSVEKHLPVHGKQLLTYLRLMKLPVGLLLNFGAPTLKEGMHRVVNSFEGNASSRLRVNQRPSLQPE